MPSISRDITLGGRSDLLSGISIFFPQAYATTAVICARMTKVIACKLILTSLDLNNIWSKIRSLISTSFIVRVPVLSLQMVVAEPIVSQADSLLTYSLIVSKTQNIFRKWFREGNVVIAEAYQCLVCHHFPHWISKPRTQQLIKEGYTMN